MRRKIQNKQGFTLVELMIAIGIVVLLAALSINSLLRSKITANEAAAIKTLKTLHSAFASYRTVSPTYPDKLSVLGTENPPYIDSTLATTRRRRGYVFDVERADSNTFQLSASPVNQGITGKRFFYIEEAGTIYGGDLTFLGGAVVGAPEPEPGGDPEE